MSTGVNSLRTKFIICLVSGASSSVSESMDRYLKLTRQKTVRGPRTAWLEGLLKEHTRVFIWGPTGTGKTWTANSVQVGAPVTVYDDDDDFTVEPPTKYAVYIGNVKTQCPENIPAFEYIPWTSRDTLRGSKGLYGTMDSFLDPTEIVARLLRKETVEVPDIAERGFMYALVHENHDTMDPRILESMSSADIFDTYIYKNSDWTFTNYFVSEGILKPCRLRDPSDIGGSELRPGSIWTKHQNMCMRRKRLRELLQKGYTLDYLPLIRDYLNAGIIQPNLETQDIDILNHVCKIKKVQAIKKQIRGRTAA